MWIHLFIPLFVPISACEKREYSLATDFDIATNWQPSNRMRSHTVRLPTLAKNAKNGNKLWHCSVWWDWQPSSSWKTRVLIGSRLCHCNKLAAVEQDEITHSEATNACEKCEEWKQVLAVFGLMGLATIELVKNTSSHWQQTLALQHIGNSRTEHDHYIAATIALEEEGFGIFRCDGTGNRRTIYDRILCR